MNEQAVIGCILGTAVGDAMGLPYEGLTPRRASRMFPDREKYHFLFGRGMVSDDTEHTCMAAQAYLGAQGDVDQFRRELAKLFRYWLLKIPAGVGFATLRSILKLWLGFSPKKSGVFSAGNGPAMRSALLGVLLGDRPQQLQQFVRASTEITHVDPKAYYGALAVALAADFNVRHSNINPAAYLDRVQSFLQPEEGRVLLYLIERVVRSVQSGQSVKEFAREMGLDRGVTGYVYHTVPIVLHAWFSSGNDFKRAIVSIIECGGDADTTAAILGGIVGARIGKQGIPREWLNRLIEYPRSIVWMENLGRQTARGEELSLPRLFATLLLLRNIFFLLIVLTHGIRRIFPSY